MKKKLLAGLAVGVMMLGMTGVASATTITYGGTSSDGIETSSIAGAVVETFNGVVADADFDPLALNTLDQNTLDQSWTWSGDGTVFISETNTTGITAAPAGDTSNFLSVPNPLSSGSLSADLGSTYNYFGLFWGSVDNYNSISFSLGGVTTETFLGSQLPQYNGDQVSPATNLYVNFMDMEAFDSFTLTSTNFAFEVDNIAVGNNPIPEPATMLLFGTGLASLVVGSKLRKKKKQ